MEEPLLRGQAAEEQQQQLRPAEERSRSLLLCSLWFVFSPVPLGGLLVTKDLTIVTRAVCFHLPIYMSGLAKLLVHCISLATFYNVVATAGILIVCIWTCHVHVHVHAHHGDDRGAPMVPGEDLVFWFRCLLGQLLVRGGVRALVHTWSKVGKARTTPLMRAQLELQYDAALFTGGMLMCIVQISAASRAGGARDLERFGLADWQQRAVGSFSFLCLVGSTLDISLRLAWFAVSAQVRRAFWDHSGRAEKAQAIISNLAEIQAKDARAAEQECPICLTSHVEDTHGMGSCLTSCGHVFHRGCLSEWANSQLSSSESSQLACPVCRANLTVQRSEQVV